MCNVIDKMNNNGGGANLFSVSNQYYVNCDDKIDPKDILKKKLLCPWFPILCTKPTGCPALPATCNSKDCSFWPFICLFKNDPIYGCDKLTFKPDVGGDGPPNRTPPASISTCTSRDNCDWWPLICSDLKNCPPLPMIPGCPAWLCPPISCQVGIVWAAGTTASPAPIMYQFNGTQCVNANISTKTPSSLTNQNQTCTW